MIDDKLVSIIVITYNSAKYVLETLESAKSQTYGNIELIVSDDCSTDNTIEVCEKWMSVNEGRFVRCKLITSEKNKGVSANCNQGLYGAKGEWIKFIAGDDLLLEDCIQNYIEFTSTNGSRFIYGLPTILTNSDYDETLMQSMTHLESFYSNSDVFFNQTARYQFNFLLINEMPVNPPASFFHRDSILGLNGFDQRYTCEDLPFLLKATFNGYQLSLLKKVTVKYRIHENQLSSMGKNGLINEYWFYEQLRFKRAYFNFKFICLNPRLCFEYLIQVFSKLLILKIGNDKNYSSYYTLLRSFKRRLSFSYIKQ